MAAGSAVAMIGANLRFGAGAASNSSLNATRMFQCHPGGSAQAALIFLLGSLGITANVALMAVILSKKQLRRWSQGLLFHQALVDCARAALLLPLGISIFKCQPVNKCSLLETAFLLLVTVSTVNMLTTVLNDSPVFPEREEDHADLTGPLLMDSPQCVLFGTFIIWFASITINLGPTFLSGALAASADSGPRAPSCPLVHGPYRHYVLNVLWIAINLICVTLTLFHLRKLHRDLTKANVEAVRVAGLVTSLLSVTGQGAGANGAPRSAVEEQRRMRSYLERVEREGVRKVRLFMVSTAAYVLCWGPLFLVTLILSTHAPHHRLAYEITLHVSHAHAAINPCLFLCLHRALRRAAVQLCCGCCVSWSRWVLSLTAAAASPLGEPAYEPQGCSPEPPPCPPPPPHASHTMLGNSAMMLERWTAGSEQSDGGSSVASSAQQAV